MGEKQVSYREARSAARLAVYVAVFVAIVAVGIVLLATGNWIPGGVILAAALVGLAAQIPVIRNARREGPTPSPPRDKTAS